MRIAFLRHAAAFFLVVVATVSTARAGSKVTYDYDRNGNRTAVTTQASNGAILEKTTYAYDEYRRPISKTEAAHTLPNPPPPERTWQYFYDRYFIDNGNLRDYGPSAHTSKQWRLQYEPAFDAAGNRNVTARWFDANDRIVDEYTGVIQGPGGMYNGPDIEVHHFSYDENGQKKSYTDPRGRVTDYTYDNRNRLRDTIEPKRADQATRPTTTTDYDFAGNKTDVNFPDTRSQHWRDYDAFGQPRKFIDERNNTTDLGYCWGPMKKLCTVTTHRSKDGGGTEDQPTVFWSDPIGRPIRTSFPDGSTEETGYEFGQVKTVKTRKNQIKRISYDVRGREIAHTWDGNAAPGVNRSWNDANRIVTLCNIYSTIKFEYDGAGQVRREENSVVGSGGTAVTTYKRYPSGAVSEIKYPYGGYFRRDYNSRGQLAAAGSSDGNGNWLSQFINYHYYPDGKLSYQNHGNGVQTMFDYDERGTTKQVHHYRLAPYQNYTDRTYTRDSRDRIVASRKSSDAAVNPMENGRGDRFQYDEEGQLVEAWYNASDPVNSGAGAMGHERFGYDELGNRSQNNLLSRWGETWFARRDDNKLNQYLHWSGTPINHDGNGVILQDGGIDATYNALNQPVSMTSPGSGGTVWFGYDPLGRCVIRWGNTWATYYYYDGSNLIQEGPSATNVSRRYVHGARVDEIVTSWNGSEQAYHHYDARGHATLLTNSGGSILEQYEYDAFGQPYVFAPNGDARTASQFGNRFLFTGREWLKELSIYDYRARMYQPELGRFLQPDPTHFAAGDYNLYRYCHNDPVNKSDPTGLRKLTMEGGGDWVKGSDGLSAWDREVGGMPSNRWQAGPNGAGNGGNDNARLYGAINKYKNKWQPRNRGVSSEEVARAAFDDGREAGELTADAFRSDSKGRYNIEHASSEYAEGDDLQRDGPVPGKDSRYAPHADLPYRTDGTHRFIGSHGHGIQSEKGFAEHDIYISNGSGGKGWPFISSLGHAGDRGHKVIIYVPTGGGQGLYFRSTNGRDFYMGQ